MKVDIISTKYKIYGNILIEPQGEATLNFIYKNQPTVLKFDMVINQKTSAWLSTIAELMINDYVEKEEEQQKAEQMNSLFTGGTEW